MENISVFKEIFNWELDHCNKEVKELGKKRNKEDGFIQLITIIIITSEYKNIFGFSWNIQSSALQSRW